MGLIPFLGDDSEKEEDGFKGELDGFADNTELSRGEQKESNEEVAEMHKSRSRKAFQENEQFSGSSGEWRKATDTENSFSEKDTGPENLQEFENAQEEDRGQNFDEKEDERFQNNQMNDQVAQSPENSQKSPQSIEEEQGLKDGLDEMDQTLQNTVEQASKIKEEFKESNEANYTKEPREGNKTDDKVANKGEDFEEEDVVDKQDVTDSLEANISEIKKQIESGDVSRRGLEDIASRFEELVDRLEKMNEGSGQDSQASSDLREDVKEDLSSFQDELADIREKQKALDEKYNEVENSESDEVREDLSSLQDDLKDMKDKQEELEDTYSTLENAVEEASEEEGDLRVEDIETIQRIERLENEVDKIRSGEAEASEQIHTQALENEMKELRKDVRELSEALVKISEKVFR